MINNFKNKKIGIIGLGVEGLSSARFFNKKGASVYLLERKEKEYIDKEILTDAEDVSDNLIFGKNYLKNLSEFDLIVRSPGIRFDTKELADVKKKGIDVTSQTKLFFDLSPTKNVIGVTGTKGKGTTASLIHEMLRSESSDVYLGGNIGTPPLDFFDRLTPDSWVVLELSSFQLQDLTKSPHIAVMLMTTSEHMDYHKDLYEYIDAKRNILRFQTTDDLAIVNRDYPASNESDVESQGKVFYISRERETENGCFVIGSKVIIRKNGSDNEILDIKQILLPGKHNLENVCAAAMTANLAGVSTESIREVLESFKGLEHRIEIVREIDGVRFYDDSFSTTPETAIAAILAFKQPEILILGGSSKGSDFTELGKVIGESKNIKAIIGIGDEWYRMKAEFPISNFKFPIIEDATDMQTIVLAASKIAKLGDVVLLSPACASFGMFRDYKDRGEQFKTEVNKLLT